MNGNEPLLMYSGGSTDYLLLACPVEGGSWFFAFPGRKPIPRPANSAATDDPGIEAQLRKRGGVSARVKKNGDIFEVAAKHWPVSGYQPPLSMLVIGPDHTVEEKPLDGKSIWLKPAEFALCPVDATAELHVKKLIQSIRELPGDLGSAVLQSIANAGVLDSVPRIPPVPQISGRPSWKWLALTALVAGVLFGAAGYGASRLLSRAPATPVTVPLDIKAPLNVLEDAMKASDQTIKALQATVPDKGMMVLKLVLYLKSKENAPDKAVSMSSDDAAKKAFDTMVLSNTLQYNAVAGVDCSQHPQGNLVPAAACMKLTSKDASDGLAALARLVGANAAPAVSIEGEKTKGKKQ